MDFFWIAEPFASLLSPACFWEFSGKYLKEIYRSIESPGFLHVCGKTTKHTGHMVATTAQVLSIDFMTPIDECLKMVPEDVVIMGNLDPSILRYDSLEDIRRECLRIKQVKL